MKTCLDLPAGIPYKRPILQSSLENNLITNLDFIEKDPYIKSDEIK
jgi:hypothetical protein